jgi:signal transduction histidine kinase/CheY-like chemotaxis protein
MNNVPIKLVVLAAAVAGAVFLFDISLPLGVAGGVPYVVLVLVGLWFPGRNAVLWLAAAGSVLTIAGYAFSDPVGIHWMVLTNRGLALFAIWATAALAYQRLRSEEQRRQDRQLLTNASDASLGKSRFLAAASHDLRQPLQSTGLYLSVLLRRFDDPVIHEIGGKMRQSLDVMGELLEALLDISKLDSGSVVPEIEDFPIQDLLDRVTSAVSPQAEEKGLSLHVESSPLFVHSDPVLLQRIVENFVTNAVRYTEAGDISVVCQQDGESVRIDVTDTGIGIPEDAIATVFEEYFQLDNPNRNRHKGLGLGLSIVKHIARLLDHEVGVRSALGEGSTFSISVPHAETPVEATTRSVSPAISTTNRPAAVLFVDDDPAIVDAILMMFAGEGFEVQAAQNGDDALAHIEKGFRPDVLVSDYRLPGYNGIEVVRRVRQRTREDLPAIIMTGDTSAHEIRSLPHCEILHKPVDTDGLVALIQGHKDLG